MKSQLTAEVNNTFNELISEIINAIEAERKKCLAKIDTFSKSSDLESVIAEYNKVSRREELATLIKSE